MQPAKRKVNNKEFLKLVAESSGFHLYEVEDIVNHIVGNFHLLMKEDASVKIDGIGWFSRRNVKPRILEKNGIDEHRYLILTSASVTLKPDSILKQWMRECSGATSIRIDKDGNPMNIEDKLQALEFNDSKTEGDGYAIKE